MTIRFCGDCMTSVGLDASQSKLALPTCASNRTVSCDGPKHEGAVISVDRLGKFVPHVAKPSVVSNLKDVRPGHSLTRV